MCVSTVCIVCVLCVSTVCIVCVLCVCIVCVLCVCVYCVCVVSVYCVCVYCVYCVCIVCVYIVCVSVLCVYCVCVCIVCVYCVCVLCVCIVCVYCVCVCVLCVCIVCVHCVCVCVQSESKDVLPLEIALLQQVCRLPRSRGVAQLLDYYWMPGPEGAGIYLLVLERPIPCLDLFNYMQEGSGYLEEGMARHVMQQVVSALLHCHSRGVVHRDLKPENILVQLTNHNVLLLDFGSASVLKEGEYTDVAGTPEYLPPETVLRGEYFAVPATVWSLGILLFQVHYYKCTSTIQIYYYYT
uniref:non-specific serine/threonine protein kinase n=1 Tax=Oncorhynchus kisutch TaxID=8019 RepID=A0A8C7LA04_ONCKI